MCASVFPVIFTPRILQNQTATIATTRAAQPQNLIPLAHLERDYLRQAIATHTGDRKSLANALGISERALYRKIAELREDGEG